MPRYRFLLGDLLTGAIYDEFPLEDVSYSRELNGVAGFSGSLPLSVKKRIVAGRSYRDTILADSPVGFWRLGEFSGTNADDMSTVGNDGTYTATPTLGQAGLLANDTNRSTLFNGTTQYVTIADNAAYSIGVTGQLTVECWTNPNSATSTSVIVGKGVVADYEWVLQQTGSIYRAVIFTAAGAVYAQADSTAGTFGPQNGVAKHVAFTWDGTTLRLYVNGVEAGTDTTFSGTANPGGTSPVNIARRPDNVQFFNGYVDEVAIYPSTLSAARLLTHYRSGFGTPEQVIVEQELMSAATLAEGKTQLLIERGGIIVAGGIVWGVTVDTQNETVQLGGSGFLSYLERRFLRANIIRVATEQFTIVQDVLNQVQGEPGGDLGITLVKTPAGGSGVLRDRTYYGFERKQALEAIRELAEVQNGFDYELVVAGTVDTVLKQLLVSYPQRGITTDLVWEVGKDVQLLQYQGDAASMANRVMVMGEGEGTLKKIAEQSDTSMLATYPLLDRVEQHSDVKVVATLTDWAAAYLNRWKRGERTAQVRLLEAADSPYGSYIPGDVVRLRGSRGYLQVDEPWRITGFSVSVDKENNEYVDADLAPLAAFGV